MRPAAADRGSVRIQNYLQVLRLIALRTLIAFRFCLWSKRYNQGCRNDVSSIHAFRATGKPFGKALRRARCVLLRIFTGCPESFATSLFHGLCLCTLQLNRTLRRRSSTCHDKKTSLPARISRSHGCGAWPTWSGASVFWHYASRRNGCHRRSYFARSGTFACYRISGSGWGQGVVTKKPGVNGTSAVSVCGGNLFVRRIAA